MNYNDEYSFSTPYIAGDEYILWKGKPETGNLVTSRDVALIPFSIFWCGFAIFWEMSAIAGGAPFFFALFGLPFVGIGLYMLFGRFIWTSYIRKRTAYVITNKKIIRLRGNKIDMLEGKSLPSIHVEAYKNGMGTIRFGEQIYYRRGRAYSVDPYGSGNGLFMIENVANVAQVQQAIDMMERN